MDEGEVFGSVRRSRLPFRRSSPRRLWPDRPRPQVRIFGAQCCLHLRSRPPPTVGRWKLPRDKGLHQPPLRLHCQGQGGSRILDGPAIRGLHHHPPRRDHLRDPLPGDRGHKLGVSHLAPLTPRPAGWDRHLYRGDVLVGDGGDAHLGPPGDRRRHLPQRVLQKFGA